MRIARLLPFFFGTGTRASITITVIIGLLGIGVSVYFAERSSGTPHEVITVNGKRIVTSSRPPAPSVINSVDDLRQYVLSRAIWQGVPTTFTDSLSMAFSGQ
jgi:hypothetical protein